MEAVAGEGGVGRDDGVDAGVDRRLDDLGELAVGQVRRDLEEERHRPDEAAVGGDDAGEKAGERRLALQVAQALGVRRGDVDGREVDEGAGRGEDLGEVGGAVGARPCSPRGSARR